MSALFGALARYLCGCVRGEQFCARKAELAWVCPERRKYYFKFKHKLIFYLKFHRPKNLVKHSQLFTIFPNVSINSDVKNIQNNPPAIVLNSHPIPRYEWIRQTFNSISNTTERCCIILHSSWACVGCTTPRNAELEKSFLPARRVLSISQFSSSLVFSESHEKKKLVVFKKFFFIIFLINFPRFSMNREKGGKWSKVSAIRISSRCVHTTAESCRLSADT